MDDDDQSQLCSQEDKVGPDFASRTRRRKYKERPALQKKDFVALHDLVCTVANILS